MPREYQIPYELRHLIYFQAVAQHLHFRRASESLGVAQPALSRQIAQLETALGVVLFDRNRRKVELTAAGDTLLRRIAPLLQSLLKLPAELDAVAKGKTGHIRVSFTGLAMATVLPKIIRAFSHSHPQVRLELNESPTASQLKALRHEEIDCGFFHPEARAPAGLHTRLLLRERNGILLLAGHPLCTRAKLRLKDFEATPFVLFPRQFNPGFYDRILSSFSSAGIAPKIAEEVWPRANAVGLVRAGLGVTFMTPSEARHLPAEIVFRPLQGPTPESRLVMGWKTATPISPALADFTKVVAAVSGEDHSA